MRPEGLGFVGLTNNQKDSEPCSSLRRNFFGRLRLGYRDIGDQMIVEIREGESFGGLGH